MQHSLWLLLTVLFLASCATAQPSGETYKRKDEKLLAEARQLIEARRHEEAEVILTRLIEEYPDDEQLLFLRSTLLTERFAYDEASTDIRRGLELSETPNGRAYQELGAALSKAGRFSEAREAYAQALQLYTDAGREASITRAQRLLSRAEVADSLARNPVPFEPTEVPGGVNTTESFEYHPTLSVDGNRLIFTRRVNREQEDFYVSERLPDGNWGKAEPLPGINTPYDEGAQTVSADGTYMVYTSCNSPGAPPGCDLYEAFWEGDKWSPGRSIDHPGINTAYYEAQPTLSSDGRFLIFASKRPGGKGGADLYISGRAADGSYSAPGKLSGLNTAGDEQYPFWAADGQTVYFTSNGRPGLGGDDLFMARLDSTNQFSEPHNLGYPINTADNETNMFIPLAADVAYFSKRYYDARRGAVQIGLHQFPLPPHLRPRPATYVQATVTDAETGQPLQAKVSVQRRDGREEATSKRTGADGSFLTVLPAGRDYAFVVDQPGYLFHSETFTPAADATPDDPYLVRIALSPVADVLEQRAEEPIVLNNVLFASGSAELLQVSFIELRGLVQVLNANPELRIRINGHTDNVGADTDNLKLSRARAATVGKYLAESGVAGERIGIEGYGESRPVASNETIEGRRQNRRTTFQLLQ